jgi:hypothetical protein
MGDPAAGRPPPRGHRDAGITDHDDAAAFNSAAAQRLTAAWEIHAADIVVHTVVTDGSLQAGVGPSPVSPDLIIAFAPDDGLPSLRALIQAAKCGLVTLSGRRNLLNTFVTMFTYPRTAKPAGEQPGSEPGQA